MADSLDALARRLRAPKPSVFGAVFSRWEETVGPSLAARSRPLSLAEGVLTIAVDDPAWATEVRYLAPTILRRLAEIGGGQAVARIDVKVRR